MIIKTAAWADSGTIWRLYASKSITRDELDSRHYLAKGSASYAKSFLAGIEKELKQDGFQTSGIYK